METDNSFTWNLNSEWSRNLQEFIGLSRSGILRKGHWSFNEGNGDEADGEEESEEEEEEPELILCNFFNRWVEGKKPISKRKSTESERLGREDNRHRWLHNWSIRLLSRKEGKVVLIGESASSANPIDIIDKGFVAGCVIEVKAPDQIETTKGVFTLVGNLTSTKNEIPTSVRKSFQNGFPSSWTAIIRKHWTIDSDSSDSDVNFSGCIVSKSKLEDKRPAKVVNHTIQKESNKNRDSEKNSIQNGSKETSLVDWTLRSDPIDGYFISGYVNSNSKKTKTELVQAGKILSRIGPNKVKTELGIFKLNGGINKKDECLPEVIKSKFSSSFPCQWKELLHDCLIPIFVPTNINKDVSIHGESEDLENSLDEILPNGSDVPNAEAPQYSKNPASRKRKRNEKIVSKTKKKNDDKPIVKMDYNSLDESANSDAYEKEEEKELPQIIPTSKRQKKNATKKQKKVEVGAKPDNMKKRKISTIKKAKSVGKRKNKENVKKSPTIASTENAVSNGKPKKKSKSTKSKDKKSKAIEQTTKKEKEIIDDEISGDEFNVNVGDAFKRNGNVSLFSSFTSDGMFGSASFKDFSLGKCLLSAKKSRSKQNGAETPPLMSMDFEFLKNTTTQSANSSISNDGNAKAKQEITKRIKKLNKATPKQSKKAKQKAGKVQTNRNKEIDDLLQQMTTSRKGMTTPKLVRKIFRPQTPGSSDDSWDSDR